MFWAAPKVGLYRLYAFPQGILEHLPFSLQIPEHARNRYDEERDNERISVRRRECEGKSSDCSGSNQALNSQRPFIVVVFVLILKQKVFVFKETIAFSFA